MVESSGAIDLLLWKKYLFWIVLMDKFTFYFGIFAVTYLARSKMVCFDVVMIRGEVYPKVSGFRYTTA